MKVTIVVEEMNDTASTIVAIGLLSPPQSAWDVLQALVQTANQIGKKNGS